MKTKLLFIALGTLTVSTLWSQGTTATEGLGGGFSASPDVRPVSFPFWMVRKIALDLEEKLWLEQEVQLLSSENATLKRLAESLELKDSRRQLQLELVEQHRRLLESQLHLQRSSGKTASWMLWALRLLGALGAGFVLGKV